MKSKYVFAVALALASISCSTLQVNTDYDPATDFSKYKSFTIKEGTAPKNSIAADRMRAALAATLASRGFTKVESGADLNLFPHFISGVDTQLNTTGYGYAGWGGWRWGGGGMQTTTVQQIPTGTLVIDMVDSGTNKVVWRGTAKDQISTSATPEEREKKVNEVAQQLFANFPPKAKK